MVSSFFIFFFILFFSGVEEGRWGGEGDSFLLNGKHVLSSSSPNGDSFLWSGEHVLRQYLPAFEAIYSMFHELISDACI